MLKDNALLVRDQIIELLAKTNSELTTTLKHDSPFQLLIATILSAQCTDKRVNSITEKLFAAHPTVEALDQLSLEKLEAYIKSAGLWRIKARNIKQTCRMLINVFHGKVPKTRDELMRLPGVGRKTANVVLANAFNIPAFPVDTHVHRVANRLGLVNSKTSIQTESQLMNIIPYNHWNDAHHWLINHGRQVCQARRPLCNKCILTDHCQYNNQH